MAAPPTWTTKPLTLPDLCRRAVLLMALLGMGGTVSAQSTIFSENMGIPSGTPLVNAYTGWQNGSPIVFSSNTSNQSDVRNTNPSAGYTSASGNGNVYMGTASSLSRDFIISGINTTGYSSITLSFGFKNDDAGSSAISISVSTDGLTYTALTYTHPAGTNWSLITVSGTIPATLNLRIKFEKNISYSYRLDDIKLIGISPLPTINYSPSASASPEANGNYTVHLVMSPPATQAGSVTITLSGNATYGVLPDDYTTVPAPTGMTLTLPVNVGDAALSFTISVNDDAMIENSDTVTCTITGTPLGLSIGTMYAYSHIILDDDAPVYGPGDIVIVGMAANLSGCSLGADDEISFFCFKDIPTNTTIDLTDCGYGCSGTTWSTIEGFLRLTRNGPTIPAGKVVTLRVTNITGVVTFIQPDNLWTSINFNTGMLNLVTSGDQFFFMQGGTDWNGYMPSTTYNGRVLSAMSYYSTPSWNSGCTLNTSQLPPSMGCIGIALSGSSGFYKYKGDTTIATQHEWLLRLLDVASNWATFPNCPNYHNTTLGYDWLAAPKLRISPSLPGNLWNGALSTDWFDCSNWDGLYAPGATTEVRINETATHDCELGISGIQPAGTDGVCASLTLQSSTSTVWDLSLLNGADLTMGGPLTIAHSGGMGQLKATVGAGSTLTADTVGITGNTATGTEAALICDEAGSVLNVTGNLAIGLGGLLDFSGTAGSSGALGLGGDYSNAEDETHFLDSLATVTFHGSEDQSLSIATGTEYFDTLRVDKPSGNMVLASPIRIRHQLDLTDGVVVDTLAGSLVTLQAAATAVNASDNSFVRGPVQKFGGVDFTFPVGDAGYYRPCGLENNIATDADAFKAEYFHADPYTVHDLAAPSIFDHMSHSEYWTIEPSPSSLQARVVLTWNTPASGGVTDPNGMSIAHWNGTIWQDAAPCTNFGNASTGGVTTTTIQTSFGLWTLATYTPINPLPIELLSFTAVPRNGMVELAWSTASEQDNDHFTVERSADADRFGDVLSLPGAGNSQQVLHYASTDGAPLPGRSYYRLRQTDFDGSSTLSDVVPVFLQGGLELAVLYDGAGPWLRHHFPVGSVLELRDGTGRTVVNGTVQDGGLMVLPVAGLAHGVYLLRLSDGNHVVTTRFVY